MNTIYKHLLILLVFICWVKAGFGQLNEGDLMFVGFNADGSDGLAVVALVEIPANSTFYFTDNEWNGDPIAGSGAFNGGEGTLTWSTGGSAIAAGTVISFTSVGSGSPSASVGTMIRSGNFSIAAGDEVIYAYRGSIGDPTAFLSAIGNEAFSTAGTLSNTGLSAGSTAIEIDGDEDIAVYTGSTTCNTTVAACATKIATVSNWTSQDDTGDQSSDSTVPDFPDDVPAIFSGSALPVELISFSAIRTREDIVALKWVTATEENNHFFSIERSSDAKTWQTIGKVVGAGTSYETLHYSFIDEHPLAGTSYYRLKQTDYDQAFSYSVIESVYHKPSKEIVIFPNPAAQNLRIQGEGIAVSQLQLFNSLGQLVPIKVLVGGYGDIELDVSKLQAGMYYLKVKGVSDWPTSPIFIR